MSVPTGALHCPSDGTALPVGPEARVGMVVAGRYRLERFVSRGRHGDVYYARHTTVGRAVAVKALRRELTQDPTAVARFVQEARAVAALGHPNVVEMTDAGDLPDGTPFLVMEWLDGESLTAYARRTGPMPPSRAAELIAGIAAGLGACHAIGVIHRDLKPDNIIIARTPRGDVPKIVDFGLARVTGSGKKITTHGAVVGDFRYAAPEQMSAGDVDGRVDIYALGCMFFELCVGRPPQRGEPMAPAMASFAPVAARAYAVSRDARFATMDELRQALADAANGTSANLTPAEAAAVREATKAKRSWLLPTVLATFCVLAAGLAVGMLAVLDRGNEEHTASAALGAPVTPPSPPPAAPSLSPTIRIEATQGTLEVRRNDQRLGETPLSLARPTGDATVSLTVHANGRLIETIVLDARSPETFRVTAGEPVPDVTRPGTRAPSSGAASMAPEPVAPMSAPPAQDMLDPWQ